MLQYVYLTFTLYIDLHTIHTYIYLYKIKILFVSWNKKQIEMHFKTYFIWDSCQGNV